MTKHVRPGVLRLAVGVLLLATALAATVEPAVSRASVPPLHAFEGSTTHIVDVVNLTFAPDPLEVRVGDTVTWVRQSGFHNVVADDGSFNSGPPSSTWTEFSHTFTTPGEFGYFCEVHGGPGGSGMAGTVRVTAQNDDARNIWLPLVRTAP